MDLISADKRQATFDQRAQEVRQKCAAAGWDTVRVFPTSIWDETLYSVCQSANYAFLTITDSKYVCHVGLVRYSLNTQPSRSSSLDLSLPLSGTLFRDRNSSIRAHYYASDLAKLKIGE